MSAELQPWEKDGLETLAVGDRADHVQELYGSEPGCARKHPERPLLCTRLVNHQGHDHVATGTGEVLARWEWAEGDHEGPFTEDIDVARQQVLELLFERVFGTPIA